MVSRRRVRIWENEGESMRSEVSSRRRRRGGGIVAEGDENGEERGEGIEAECTGGGGVEMPDSCSTDSC